MGQGCGCERAPLRTLLWQPQQPCNQWHSRGKSLDGDNTRRCADGHEALLALAKTKNGQRLLLL